MSGPGRRLLALAAVTALAVLAALAVHAPRDAPERAQVGTPALPALAAAPDAATRIVIAGAGFALTLDRAAEGGWTWRERDGFPADPRRVAAALDGLAGLRLVAPMTARPARYPRLGVADITDPDSRALRVDIEAADAAPLGRLLIGGRPAAAVEPSVYVRRVFEARAWRAAGIPAVPRDPLDWFDRTPIDLAPDRVRRIVVERPGRLPVRLDRDRGDAAFEADGAAIDGDGAAALAALPQSLAWLDVRSGTVPDGETAFRLGFVTEDGLSITIVEAGAEVGEGAAALWVAIAAGTAPGATAAAAATAADLAEGVDGWQFRLDPALFEPVSAL